MNPYSEEWYMFRGGSSGFSRKAITDERAHKMLIEQAQGNHKNIEIVRLDSTRGMAGAMSVFKQPVEIRL